MKLMLRLAAFCALLCAGAAQAAPSLQAAERAAAQVHWAEARTEVEALLCAGGLDRPTLLGAYELRAEIAAVLDGAAAAEREYDKLLTLDPGRPAPRRTSPVFTQPFLRAQRRMSDERVLRLSHQPPETVTAGAPSQLIVQLVDPLNLVAGVRAVGTVGEQRFAQGPPPRLPALEADAVAEYRLEALDGFGNVLAIAGETTPFRVTAEAPPAAPEERPAPRPAAPAITAAPAPAPRRLWPAAAALAGAALAVGVGGVTLNVLARDQYAFLQSTCAPRCTNAQLNTFHDEVSASISLYSIAGALAGTSLVLLIVDRVHHH
jgi:hypothetical protein